MNTRHVITATIILISALICSCEPIVSETTEGTLDGGKYKLDLNVQLTDWAEYGGSYDVVITATKSKLEGMAITKVRGAYVSFNGRKVDLSDIPVDDYKTSTKREERLLDIVISVPASGEVALKYDPGTFVSNRFYLDLLPSASNGIKLRLVEPIRSDETVTVILRAGEDNYERYRETFSTVGQQNLAISGDILKTFYRVDELVWVRVSRGSNVNYAKTTANGGLTVSALYSVSPFSQSVRMQP